MEEDTKNDKTPEKVTTPEVKNDLDSSQLKSKSPKDDTAGEEKVKKNETSESSPLKSKTQQPTLKTPEKENISLIHNFGVSLLLAYKQKMIK